MQQQKFTLVKAAFELRLLVAELNMSEATKLVKRSLPPTDSLTPDPSYAALFLSLGHYHYCLRQPDKAIDFSKRAMHYYQELDNPERTAESFLDLGAEFLAKGNLREAKDYISFGKKIAHDQGRACVRVRSLALESVATYLAGNYSGVIADCLDGISICCENGMREYEHFFHFFCARALFDLGDLQTAMEHLHQCLALGTLYEMKNTRSVVYNWIARCALYSNNAALSLEILKASEETAETLFVKAEILSFQGDYKKAAKLLGKAMHMPFDHGPRFLRPVAWEHGWAGIEDLCLDLSTNGTLLFRLIRAFHAYNLARAGAVNEGIRELHEMTITDKFSPVDPAAFFCYFLYYMVLKSVDTPRDYFEDSAHGLTILNKALKHLQERATAIEEPRDRINYLSRNRWNKMLMDEAKVNKLI
ncbi:MAG: hypothetical protein EHM28_08800 [Spirochaetaceae bacterium]|nr:MAG: hypothetical protein EHM28_08800 [Spirochaetaceae bacterium]